MIPMHSIRSVQRALTAQNPEDKDKTIVIQPGMAFEILRQHGKVVAIGMEIDKKPGVLLTSFHQVWAYTKPLEAP